MSSPDPAATPASSFDGPVHDVLIVGGGLVGASLAIALDDLGLDVALLEAAPAPRTTVQSPLRWSDTADWKRDYCNIDLLSPDEIALRRERFLAGKAVAKGIRGDSG